jgi:subtilisin family serine protease
MNDTRLAGFLLALVLGAALPQVVLADDDDFEPDRVAVRLKPGASIDAINADYGTEVVESVPARHLYLLDIPDGADEDEFADVMDDDDRLEWADLNFYARDPGPGTQSFFLLSTKPAYVGQYAASLIGLEGAHGAATGDGVTVAILDSGIDAGHPEFDGAIAGGGYNFINGNTDTSDVGDGLDSDADGLEDEMVGHGTFVAGLIRLAAPGAMILPVKVLDSDGQTTSFIVAEGIDHAIGQGAGVINLSLGSLGENIVMVEAAAWAEAAGVLIVAAAGNEGTESPAWYPAGVEGVLAGAATDAGDIRAVFSNYGQHIDLCAPGVEIVSTTPGGEFGRSDGTSYSAPLLAGVAALVMEVEAGFTPAQVIARMAETAINIDEINPGYEGKLGAGRVDAAAAVGGGCAPDLDGDGGLTLFDFLTFVNLFNAKDARADCDGNGAWDLFDFLCFVNGFNAGC